MTRPTTPQFFFPPLMIEGIELINQGHYFEAHEVLENEWRKETRPIRGLYQGLIQFSVACLHLQRGNLKGAKNLLAKAVTNFSPFLEDHFEIDLAQLLKEMEQLDRFIGHISLSKSKSAIEITFPKILWHSKKAIENP